jgi:hypothetical protein
LNDYLSTITLKVIVMGSLNSKNHNADSALQNMVNNQNTNPVPQKDKAGNWDEKAHMSRNIQKNMPQNERRNLNPDREKRTGSNLNPDRNSGDR